MLMNPMNSGLLTLTSETDQDQSFGTRKRAKERISMRSLNGEAESRLSNWVGRRENPGLVRINVAPNVTVRCFSAAQCFFREDFLDFPFGMFSKGINTAQATTVVHILGFPMADCVIF